jgi:hypothetical protein
MGGGDNSARYQVLENVYETDGVVDAFSINRITLTRTHHIFNPAGGETLPSARSGCEFEDFALRWLSLHILHPDSHFLIQASVVSSAWFQNEVALALHGSIVGVSGVTILSTNDVVLALFGDQTAQAGSFSFSFSFSFCFLTKATAISNSR